MQTGFAFLEAGSVRSKNTTNILIKNFLDVCKYSRLIVFIFKRSRVSDCMSCLQSMRIASRWKRRIQLKKFRHFYRLGYGVLLIYNFGSYFNYFFQLLVRWLIGYSGSPLLLEMKATDSLDTTILLWLTYLPPSTPCGFSTSFSRQLRQQLSAVPWPRELSSRLIFCTLCFLLVSIKDLKTIFVLSAGGWSSHTLYNHLLFFFFVKGALTW